jgi:hypothetical protein
MLALLSWIFIIIGRPFFRTTSAIIDVKEGNMKFQFPHKNEWSTFQGRRGWRIAPWYVHLLKN